MIDDAPDSSAPKPSIPPELSLVVRAGVRAGNAVPGAVAVGGTVCSLYAAHRKSLDIDFVIEDLAQRFEEVQEDLNSMSGWKTQKTRPPVLILGTLDHVPIGYRQLRRRSPLDTLEFQTPDGTLIIPTLPELLRIKAFLACERNCTRDFLDFAELSRLLPADQVIETLAELDARAGWEKRPEVALEIIKSLAACEPHDLGTNGFETFKFLNPRMKSWEQVRLACHEIAMGLSTRLLQE